MQAARVLALLGLVALAAGCGAGQRESGPATEEARASPSANAVCAEHGVLEALCTKCNPALVPVFRGQGDWCAEHGFAMSICPVHHPERGGRPALDVGGDEAPGDGTRVRFKSRETARRAGIRSAAAVALPLSQTVAAPARIVYDAGRVAHLNARAPGVIRAIQADVGSRMRPGASLAIIESAGLGSDEATLRVSQARLAAAEAELERATRLRDGGVLAERDVLAARREVEEARAALASAQVALGVVGPTAAGSGRYTLVSPIAGVVTRRGAMLEQLVTPDDLLFEVVDTTAMWAELDLAETDLAAVAVGQRVTLEIEGLADREFAGELSYIAPEIDPRTRTVKARLPLENPEGLLRANMFGRARVAAARSRESVLVPASALQRARDAELVFVRLAEDLYEVRRVRRGARVGELVEVAGNVRAGDEVVTEGAFLLKTETLRENIGAGCCDVE